MMRLIAIVGVVSLLLGNLAVAQVRIDATTAHQMAESGEVLLLDIRTPREWQRTGVSPLAETLNLRSSSFGDDFMRLIEGDRDLPVALICASGGRSGHLASILAQAGFTSVYDVSEGMLGSDAGPGWLATGLPTEAFQP